MSFESQLKTVSASSKASVVVQNSSKINCPCENTKEFEELSYNSKRVYRDWETDRKSVV